MAEIGTRAAQPDTTVVSEHVARLDAEQEAQTLTTQPATVARSVGGLDRREGVGKVWRAGCIHEGRVERLGASHDVAHWLAGQECDKRHKELGGGIFCRERGHERPQQDSSSTLPFLLVMTTTSFALDIVLDAAEGEGLEARRREVLEFDP